MKIKGHEIHYMRTVGADTEISEFCRDGQIQNLQERFEGSTKEGYGAMVTFVKALQNAWEEHEAWEHEDYEPFLLTDKDLEMLHPDMLTDMFSEASTAYAEDSKVTVETQEPSGAKKKDENGENKLS